MDERYNKLINSIKHTGCMVIFWKGMPYQSDVLYVSDNICLLELTVSECMAEGFLENRLVDKESRICGISRKSMKDGQCDEYDIEFCYYTVSGREIWINERTTVYREGNDIEYGETILRDISVRKNQEKMLDSYSCNVRDYIKERIYSIAEEDISFRLGTVMSLKELQSYQDIFCESQNVYAVCYDNRGNRVTRISCNDHDRKILFNDIGREKIYNEFRRAVDEILLSGSKQTFHSDVLGMEIIGNPLKYNSGIECVWLVTYVLPQCTDNTTIGLSRKITKENADETANLLEILSSKFISASYSTSVALAEAERSEIAKRNMEEEYRRNIAFTSIVQLLEEEHSFEDAAKIVLNIVVDFLNIEGAVLVKVADDRDDFEIIAEWVASGFPKFSDIESFSGKFCNVDNGLVVISGGQDRGDFAEIMDYYGCEAGVFVPIYQDGKLDMYVSFADNSKDRVWDSATVRFLSDVGKMIQTILYKKNAKDSLISSYRALREILDNIGSEICVIDKDTKEILFCNDIVKKVCRRDMVGKKCSDYRETCSLENCDNCPVMKGNEYFEEKYNARRGMWYEVKYNDITWVDGRTVSLCNMTDVTEKKKYQKRIEFQANNDFLTGLYNRMRCEEDLELCIRETISSNANGALLFMDLDNFKNINDGLGHQYGDVLLKTISVGIQQIEEINGHCYRVGGDEFIMIIEPEVYSSLDRILDELKKLFSRPWYLNGKEYYCTMSMGIVRFPEDGRDVNSLIRKADIAMYDAKKSGKNRFEYYNHGEDISVVEKLDIEKNMRSAVAIGCNEFEIYIQPIIDATNEKCIGGEALIRWNSGELGMLTPGEFIPLAEHLGLITPIGEYVLRQACMANRRWSDGGIDLHVNVNLSVVQLLQNNVVETIENSIKMTGVNPDNLILEVTESLAINDMNRMKRIIKDIKKLGVHIALDDFGTGYSSLNYIKQMDLDVIKVDRTFIKDIKDDDYAQTFVKLISELSQKLNVKVCVEGVEEKEQFDVLKEMNVALIQGFYFGKPMPLEEFERKYVYSELEK